MSRHREKRLDVMIDWQEPPSYVQLIEEAESVAKGISDSLVCGGLGYVADEAAIRHASITFGVRVGASQSGERASSIMTVMEKAAELEKAKWLATMTPPEPATPADMAADFNQIVARCNAAAAAYPEMLAIGEDTPTSGDQLVSRVAGFAR